jgi:hypothetical protein
MMTTVNAEAYTSIARAALIDSIRRLVTSATSAVVVCFVACISERALGFGQEMNHVRAASFRRSCVIANLSNSSDVHVTFPIKQHFRSFTSTPWVGIILTRFELSSSADGRLASVMPFQLTKVPGGMCSFVKISRIMLNCKVRVADWQE